MSSLFLYEYSADQENSVGGGGGGPDNVFSHQVISKGAVRISLEKQLYPRGLITAGGGSYKYNEGNI